MRKTAKMLGGFALAAAMLLSVAPGAEASRAAVTHRGSCSAASDWKLKAKHDGGRIELDFEVDSNVVGQTWNVAIRQDGTRIFKGTRVTKAPSGSFEVRRRPADTAGPDRFVVRAKNRATGETCVGRVTV
jgi:hypothetical protein